MMDILDNGVGLGTERLVRRDSRVARGGLIRRPVIKRRALEIVRQEIPYARREH